jgi:YVTN family beta-propeller protein
VTNIYDDTVSVVNAATHTVVDTVAVGNEPCGVAVNPAGTGVYVVNKSGNTVSVIDTSTNTVTGTVPVGNLPYALGRFIRPIWDTDGDGLSDEWELTYFGDINQGPNDNPDGDSLTNLAEYQGLTDPTTFDAAPAGNTPPLVGSGGGGGGGCFIATAAYGSALSHEVIVFKQFRDEYLLINELGRALVSAYYRYGPILAHYVAKHPTLRKVARIGLYPLLEVGKWLVGEDDPKPH